jgi:hypothetical protein
LAAQVNEILKIVPGLATAVSFMVLSLAFVHELAFYSVIGDRFQALMGVTDYFNSAIGWLPWAVLGMCVAAVLIISERRSANFVSYEEKDAFYKQHPMRRFWREGPFIIAAWAAIIGGVVQLLVGDWYSRGAFELAFMVLWAKFLRWLVSHEKIKLSLSKELAILFLFAPAVLFAAYVNGLVEGAESLSKREPIFIGRLKNENQERQWYILRNLSRGLIVRAFDGDRLLFVKWDDVAVLESQFQPPNRSGLACRIAGVFCHWTRLAWLNAALIVSGCLY